MIQSIILIIAAIIAVFLTPLIAFSFGFFFGFIIKLILGSIVISGLDLLGLHISPEDLPLLFGTINLIAAFFWTPKLQILDKKAS